MKKHQDLLYTLLGISVIPALILITYCSQQPKPLSLEFTEQTQSKEHSLVNEILADTETFAANEDAKLNQTTQPGAKQPIPLPVAGAPLPVAWDSKSAPNLAESELSPSLQRSLEASASLSAEEYTNPSSDFNLERVEDLRAIRKNRHQTE